MADWTSVNAGELHWQVHPAWQGDLFDAHGLRLSEWNHQGRVEVIKEAWHRSIVCVHLPQGSIYVKHYPLNDFSSHIRQLVRPSKARDEFECAIGVQARSVPTIEPIALGETPSGESYFITRGLDDAIPLSRLIEVVLPSLPPTRRQRLRLHIADELARFLALMHEVGVVHPDLHPGNLLVRLDPGDQLRLHLIDLHAVRLCRPLNWQQSSHNLVMLNRWFVQRAGRTDRRRFWRTYFAHRRNWDVPRDQMRCRARDLETRTWESCLRFWRNREQRCLTNNRYFRRVRAGGNSAWCQRDLPEDVMRPLVANPEILRKAPGFRILKQSRSSVVAEATLRIGEQPRTIIFKRFVPTKWRDAWLSLFRPSPALRSWVNGFRLLNSGLPTAQPLAVIHRRRFGLVAESYLLAEKLPDAVDLHDHLAGLSQRPEARKQGELVELIDGLAKLVRQMHDRRFSHRDLKASNILVRRGATPSLAEAFVLIDLAGMRSHRRMPERSRVQNLARLNVSILRHPWISRTARLRFLRGYLRWGLHGRQGWKELWRQVARVTESKMAINRKRKRPLS